MALHGRAQVAEPQAMQRHLGTPPNKKKTVPLNPDDKTVESGELARSRAKLRDDDPSWFEPRQPADVKRLPNGENIDGN